MKFIECSITLVSEDTKLTELTLQHHPIGTLFHGLDKKFNGVILNSEDCGLFQKITASQYVEILSNFKILVNADHTATRVFK